MLRFVRSMAGIEFLSSQRLAQVYARWPEDTPYCVKHWPLNILQFVQFGWFETV